MRWDLAAIDKLKDYTAKKNAAAHIPAEIARLEDDFKHIRSATMDATPVEGGGNRREDMLLANICQRTELWHQLNNVELELAGIEKALDALTAEERLVLERFYINPHKGSVDWLCEELGIERPTVYKRKDAAREKFTKLLYGAVST